MNKKSTNLVCFICGIDISTQLSANQTQDPKRSICKECEERKHIFKCEICGDTVNTTVYETHLRDSHTIEQMATQIAIRMIDSLKGH